MSSMNDVSAAAALMEAYADRTGLTASDTPPRRYLWTDAFAVGNFLGLARRTGDDRYRTLALELVDQVHTVLGRHRPDDPRSGWISGLGEEEGQRHPTIGGLRIGKERNERGPEEHYDERQEWDRDGQYFHYLTKWLQALDLVGRATGESVYHRWAVEMARTCHARFITDPDNTGRRELYWKMSIDLSRPLVPAAGQHDPLDGLLTYLQLQAAAPAEEDFDLDAEIDQLAALCGRKTWVTDDALGIGGLLVDAFRLGRLISQGADDQQVLFVEILDSARQGLQMSTASRFLALPADYRLAFRELGLVIGLKAITRLGDIIEDHPTAFADLGGLIGKINALRQKAPLGEEIERFWLAPAQQTVATWQDHEEINTVMLATSLVPDGFLG